MHSSLQINERRKALAPGALKPRFAQPNFPFGEQRGLSSFGPSPALPGGIGVLWILCLFLFLGAITSLSAAPPVTLAWDANSEPDLDGYRLHYGLQTGQYTTTLDVENVTTTTLSNLNAGATYYFVVTAYNNAGLESLPSNEVSFTVPPNQPPTITLTGPANGTSFNAPATIAISANASDPDGSIARVEFWVNAAKVEEKTTGPFTMTWDSAPPGDHTITVRAYDNLGLSDEATTLLHVVKLAVSTPPQFTAGGSFELTITGAPGRTTHVWASEDLETWTLIEDLPNPTGTVVFTDPAARNFAQRFYKVSSD